METEHKTGKQESMKTGKQITKEAIVHARKQRSMKKWKRGSEKEGKC